MAEPPSVCIDQTLNPMQRSCYAHGSPIKCLFLCRIWFIKASQHLPCFTEYYFFIYLVFPQFQENRKSDLILLYPIWKQKILQQVHTLNQSSLCRQRFRYIYREGLRCRFKERFQLNICFMFNECYKALYIHKYFIWLNEGYILVDLKIV